MEGEKDEYVILSELYSDKEKWATIEGFLKNKKLVKITQRFLKSEKNWKRMKAFCRVCWRGDSNLFGTVYDRICPECLAGEILMYVQSVKSASLKQIAEKTNEPLDSVQKAVSILVIRGEMYQTGTGLCGIPENKFLEMQRTESVAFQK